MNGRRVRPTLRCLQEDLRIDLPPIETPLEEIDHSLLEEVRRIAPQSPQGQKRILSIKDQMVYRVQKGRLRGATWVDEQDAIVWLLAAEERQEGSEEDAYVYFESLHSKGALMPSADDRLRDRVDEAARFVVRLRAEATIAFEDARDQPGTEVEIQVNGVEILLLTLESGGVQEVWLAVDKRVPARVRDVAFAIFEEVVTGSEWEWRSDWPTRTLEWFEVARMGLREATSS